MKLFVLLSRIPWPLEKGDKLRAYHQLKHLSEKHEVFLCCLSDSSPDKDAIQHLHGICAHLEILPLRKWKIGWRLLRSLFSDRPFQVHYFYQSHAARKIRKMVEEFQPDHIYCQLIRTSEYVKHIIEIQKTIDYMDAFNAGHRRRIERSPWFMKPLLREEAKRLVAYENLIFDYFDHHTIISAPDRRLLFHPLRDKVRIIPNGVDSIFFSPHHDAKKTVELVFTGNMSYPPNVDCAKYIVNEVLPLVHIQLPAARLLLAGANPISSIKKLASDSVIVTGWVEDIRDAYKQAQIFVAPMQIGTGLQNKLLEAMSMELPCITSSLASGALGGNHGEHYLLGDNPQEIADHIIDLLQHPQKASEMATRGRNFILAHFDWKKTVEELEKIMQIHP